MESVDKRPFGLWTATALVVGGMIGSGIFTLPAQLAPFGWTGLAAWIACAAGAMLIAVVLARLAATMPEASGVVAICADALGPLPGMLIGWAYWVGVWSANAYIALTAVRYLGTFWPPLTATPLSAALGAVALIWLITALNLRGAKAAGRFQVVTTALKILPLVAVVVIVAGFALAGGGQFRQAPHAPFAWNQLTPAVTFAFFALVGFESASIAAERVQDPARNVVRATIAGLALTAILYVIVCTGIVFALPEKTAAEAAAPMALFVATFWGPSAGLAIAGFAVIATVGCLNGWILLQGELPLGMSRAGVLPRWVGTTNDRDVPVGALVMSSVLASVLILSSASKSTGALYNFILLLTTAATLWIYIGACLSALKLGIARAPALLGLGFALWALWGSGIAAGGLSIALILAAIPLYVLARRATLAEQPA
ncbi:MAG: amino acid permease [Pseudomonadota bacterium]